MALSKIDAELTATTTVPSEGGAATTNVVQGLAKAWVNLDGTSQEDKDPVTSMIMGDLA